MRLLDLLSITFFSLKGDLFKFDFEDLCHILPDSIDISEHVKVLCRTTRIALEKNDINLNRKDIKVEIQLRPESF